MALCQECTARCRVTEVKRIKVGQGLTLRQEGQSVGLFCSNCSVYRIFHPDQCSLQGESKACDFCVTGLGANQLPLSSAVIEFKTGAWAYKNVGAQLSGGLGLAKKVGFLLAETIEFVVVAGEGPHGATQSLGGLRTIEGKRIRHVKSHQTLTLPSSVDR